MARELINTFAGFNQFSFLCLNKFGQFLRFITPSIKDTIPVPPDALPTFLREKVVLREGTTDVFIWVHGWQNNFDRALSSARKLFGCLDAAIHKPGSIAAGIIPSYLAVHWPSVSPATPKGYATIRNRAGKMTEKGDAEFFLASLLGYLESHNQRVAEGSGLLKAAGGYYVHTIGHSFGCRFLTAAITAAARPRPRTLSLLGRVPASERKTLSARTETLFDFTVDTACFIQMAAPSASFSDQLSVLVEWAPFRGPLALTYSKFDRANCLWHWFAEKRERAIGCTGATAPSDWIGQTMLRKSESAYPENEFGHRIVNIDASAVYTNAGLRPEGAHSDFWYEETMHLILSLALHARRPTERRQ
jgi:hypothetical protein